MIRYCSIIAFLVQETKVSLSEAPDFVFEIGSSHELNTENIVPLHKWPLNLNSNACSRLLTRGGCFTRGSK